MTVSTIEGNIAQALLSALKLQSYAALTYAWPETPFDPSQTPQYLSVQLVNNNHGWQSINDEAVERLGFLIVTVVYQKGLGVILPYEIAGAIIAAWKKGTTLIGPGVKVVISPEPYMSSPISDPTRVSIPVNIPWKAYAR